MPKCSLLAALLGSALALGATAAAGAGDGSGDLVIRVQSQTDPSQPNPLAPFLKGLLRKPETPPAPDTTAPNAVEPEPETTEVPASPPPRTTPEPATPPATAETPGTRRPQSASSAARTPATPPRTAEPEPTPPAPSRPAAPPPPASQVAGTISPNALIEVIRDEVDHVRVDTSGGDTTLEGAIDGTDFQVYFYECDGGDMASVAEPDSDCLGYEFRAYFPDYPTEVRRVNQWNADHHYGKLWVDDDGDLALQINVVVEGGVAEDNALANLKWFRVAIGNVHDFYR